MKKTLALFSLFALTVTLFTGCKFLDRFTTTDRDAEVQASPVTVVEEEELTPDLDIEITSPEANAEVSFPLTIIGKARGTWYFEGSFGVRLLDNDGKELVVTFAQAQDDWTTEDFVPFTATIDSIPAGSTGGTIVFAKDNPSGLPQNDKRFEWVVSF